MMTRILALTWAGFLHLVRSRVYLNLVVAGIFLVAAAKAFDELSAGAGGRVLLDVGCAFVSLTVAALAGALSITVLTRDIETKHVHLLAARPVTRAEIVVARFCTIALLVLVANLTLGGILSVMLWAVGFPHAGIALAACVFASLEGLIIAAIAVFFGVASSSTMSAIFTTTLFVLGRLSGELSTLLERGHFGAATSVMRGVYLALPHLSAFDLTPLAHGTVMSAAHIAQVALYGLAYAAAFLIGACVRFTRSDLL
jgi:ABC-type transport system involved in multi-copper enzyme maturation permease subunit